MSSQEDEKAEKRAALPRPAPANPAMREGDSARARFYRAKDELLDFPTLPLVEAVNREGKDGGGEKGATMALFLSLKKVSDRLDSDPSSEEALAEGESLLRQISEAGDRLGVPRYDRP